ncbi:MAG TPA: hypothetical protein VEH47_08700 [Candidatus Acidoferrales bacterium]|nr:hypothetical protein [Candidatus Acidoferrales bacterium]
MTVLQTELNFLNTHKAELLKQYGGKYLVIKGEQVSGAYDTMSDALQASALMHGLDDVLIRRAEDADLEVSVPALTLGILHAGVSHPDSGTRENS